ncbi:signal peptidase I [Domibacillus tundrae]|uniref:signal peptidase I n=1 Tax=Domibacillus tundrae TaxID=1587527 RepID=UPI003395CD2B
MKKYLLVGIALLLASCTTEDTPIEKPAKGYNTKPVIKLVEPSGNFLLVDWANDNMDRGNHDYDTYVHSRLVVDLDYSNVQRGDVIYFNTPEFESENPNLNLEDSQISRVVGLPGETIEIKDGKVFINDRKLDYFYSNVTFFGMEEEEYFAKATHDSKADKERQEDYFSTDMKFLFIPNDSVFVLGDSWWRSSDSRSFGALPMDQIKGKVLGYEKNGSKSTVAITKEFLESNAEIGMTKQGVKGTFGKNHVSDFSSDIWMYDRVKNNYQYEMSLETVAFKDIKDELVHYQLFINFVDGKAFMYSYFYKGDDGKIWEYVVNPDKTITEVVVSN